MIHLGPLTDLCAQRLDLLCRHIAVEKHRNAHTGFCLTHHVVQVGHDGKNRLNMKMQAAIVAMEARENILLR